MQPIMTENAGGDKHWQVDGKDHRVDGPAIEYRNGEKIWCMNNIVHRTDGPAFEYPDGRKSWYLHGSCYTFDEWLIANTEISDEGKVMMKLQYG